VMPAWRQRLNEDELRLTTAWVLAQRTPSRAP
jgi:hypothetical protein